MTEGQPPAVNEDLIQRTRDDAEAVRAEVAKVVVGQTEVIDQVLLAMLCRGHALLVGVPGLAKTLLISTIARTMNLAFSRIQFTPDLMPSDITGTEVIEEDHATGKRHFRFVKGPIFAGIVLADEINRTPPKTQSALLEAMQEHHVTVAGERYDLPAPFFVLATQNPIEQEGTYPLPEAQLDRFMLMVHVGYPDEEQEAQVVKTTTASATPEVSAILDGQRVLDAQSVVRDVPVADHVVRYALRLVRATRKPGRNEPDRRPQFIEQYLAWGAGPRASQYLVLAAKGRALMDGRTHATIDDIRAMAHPVLRHRVITNFNAEADGVTPDDLVDRLIETVDTEGADPVTTRQMNTVVR